ncbi:hypothetical protein EYC80_010775 [Monilinia laxa]|uniref:Uncharacterized protein n=1 Tax=Monilinia laxa TaxID=61186 RepID=A0A5N6JM96_MONLA|nr:hypothetical protein EYC80_010775 [Monilinia laxa]
MTLIRASFSSPRRPPYRLARALHYTIQLLTIDRRIQQHAGLYPLHAQKVETPSSFTESEPNGTTAIEKGFHSTTVRSSNWNLNPCFMINGFAILPSSSPFGGLKFQYLPYSAPPSPVKV